jgi:hypothetical protein
MLLLLMMSFHSVTKPELILHNSGVLGSSYTLSLWKSSDSIVDDF